MKIHLLSILTLVLLSSCGKTHRLPIEKSEDYFFLEDSRVFVKPVAEPYKKALSVNGIMDFNEKWVITVKQSDKSMDILRKTYSEENVIKLKKEFVEIFDIETATGEKGFYANYIDRRKRNTHLLALNLGDENTIVTGTAPMYAGDVMNEKVKLAILSTYIATEEEARKMQEKIEVTPNKRNNIFAAKEGYLKFAGELDNNFYYTRDGLFPTESPDSLWIKFNSIWNTSPKGLKKVIFKDILNEDYEIDEEISNETSRKKATWFAREKSSTKLGVGGYKVPGSVIIFRGSFIGNEEKNIEELGDFINSVRLI